jgi:hypothetical protein
MATIQMLGAPSYAAAPKADFGTLGDLANTYQTAQQQQLKMQQDAGAGDLAKRQWAVQNGLPDPGQAPQQQGWLSSLKSYIGMPQSPQPWAPPQGSVIPQSNVVSPTATSPYNFAGGTPMPMARPPGI